MSTAAARASVVPVAETPVRAPAPVARGPADIVPLPLPARDRPTLPLGDIAPPRDAETDRRAAEIRQVIDLLAPLLGLDPARVDVRVDAAAAARITARGADALMEDGVVLLHPNRFAPDTVTGRATLAHELVHVAQRAAGAAPVGRAGAEAEADRIAQAFVTGRAVTRPARRIGQHGWATKTAAAPSADVNAASDIGDRQGEYEELLDGLDHWIITDNHVNKILGLLASLPLTTAMALVGHLPYQKRYDLLHNINPVHVKSSRAEVLLVFAATPAGEIKFDFARDLFRDLVWIGLTPAELIAIKHTYDALGGAGDDKLDREPFAANLRNAVELADQPDTVSRYADTRDKALEEELKERRDRTDRRARAAKLLTDPVQRDALNGVMAKIRGLLDKFWVKDADALAALELCMPYANNPAALQAIADGLVKFEKPPKDDASRRVEDKNYLDKLIDELPVEPLYDRNSPRLGTLLQLMSVRPAYKNVASARRVMDRLFVDANDAFLAFQLIKALPDREKTAFADKALEKRGLLDHLRDKNSSLFSAILAEMTPSQRESLGINLYSGGKDREDRNAILLQLSNSEIWFGEKADAQRLSGLCRMAIAAGNHAWLFDESQRQYKAHATLLDDEAIRGVVDKYVLYNPRPDAKNPDGSRKPRLVFEPALYKAGALDPVPDRSHAPPSVLARVFGLLRLVGHAIFNLRRPRDKAVALSGIDLTDAQVAAGGDLGVVTLTRHEDNGPAGRDAIRTGRGVNIIDDLRWNYGANGIELAVDELSLANVHLPLSTMKVQAGSGSLRNVSIVLVYPSQILGSPMTVDLTIGELELDDVLVILPDAMYGAEAAQASGLRLLGQGSGDPQAPAERPEEALLPIGIGVIADMIRAYQKIGGREQTRRPLAIDVSVDTVRFRGLTTSGGQFARNVTVKDVSIRGGGDRAAYQEALEGSRQRLATRIDRERKAASADGDPNGAHARVSKQLENQLKMVATEQADFAEFDRLRGLQQAHDRDPAGTAPLEPEQVARLQVLDRRFGATVGLVADIGSITAEGLQGLPVSSFKAENLHGQGASLQAVLGNGMLTQTLIGQPLAEPGKRQDVGFSLAIGNLETSGVHVRGAIPTPEMARKDLAIAYKNQKPGDTAQSKQIDELRHRSDMAGAYALLLSRGVENLDDTERVTLMTLRADLEALEERNAISVKQLAVEGTVLSATEAGQLTAHVDTLTAVGVEQGKADDPLRGRHAERITATDLTVSAQVRDGLFGLKDWRGNLKSGAVQAGTFDVYGARDKTSGTDVEHIGLTNAAAGLDRTGKGSVSFKADRISVANVSVKVSRDLLLAERELLTAAPGKHGREREELHIQEINEALMALAEIDRRGERATAALDQARAVRNAGAITKAERDVAAVEKARLEWQNQLVARKLDLQHLDLVAEGLGDVLSEDFNIEAVLAKGITIRSSREDGQLLGGGTVEDARIPGLTGKSASVGPIGGSVTVNNEGVTVTGFSIASVTVNGLDYHGGGTRIWSNGTSSMTGITLDAKGTFTSFKDKNGFDDRRLSGIIINTMKIKNISADRIGYSSRDAGISAEVLSGGLEDIDVTGMVIELPPEPGAKPKVTGKVGVHGIDHLRLNAVIGRELTLRGTLTGSDIKVALLNGGERVHVGDLSLDKGEILGGKNGLSRITVTHLSGDVSRQDTATGDVVELRNINLAVARLEAGANWSGGGTALRFDGGAEIRKLSVDAKITRRRDGKKMVIQQVEIPLLHVDSITADAVTIHTDAVAYDPESGTDPAPAKTLSLVHAKITDLNVEGFDLAKRLGTLRVGREDINDLGLVIAERGNDAFKEAHLNLHGTGLTGTVTGAPNPPDTVTPSGTAGSKEGSPGARGAVAGTPAQGEPLSSSLNTLLPGLGSNIVTVNLGHIERISGSYQDAKTKVVSASATDIGGTAEIGPDYVQLRDIEVGAMHLGTTTYSDRPGNQIRLSGANATGVRLSSLRADFSSTKKEGDLSLSRISLRGLHFGRIVADNFLYTGMSESEDKTGQKVVSQSQVKAGRAVVAPLDVEELDHSMLSDVTHIKADIGQVSLHRFVGDFNTQVAGKLSSAVHFATDLTAGGLKADMFLEPGVGPDGERTTDVQGTFHLDRLGLRHTSLVYAGFKGGKPDVAVTVALDKAAKAGINIKGLDVGLSPDGGLQLRLDDVIARHLKVNAKIGDKTISVELPFGRIRAIALGLEGKKVPEAMQRLALTTGDIVTSGLHVTAHLVRSAPPKGGVAPKGDLILEPLGGANGVLRLTNEIGYGEKDTDWLELAVENGMIDLDHSLLFPTAPDARLPGEESLEKLNKWLSKVITGDSDLTKIDLRKLVEGKLNDPGGPSTGKPTDLSILNYLGLRQSKVTLGAGRIGTPKYGINLVAGVPAINLFEILPSVIGKQLDITTKLLAGTSFDFATSDTDAQGNETVTKGQTGIVAFTKVRISIIGLGSEAEFDVDLRTEGGFVRGVTFGDVSLITKELIPDPDAGKTPAAGGGP